MVRQKAFPIILVVVLIVLVLGSSVAQAVPMAQKGPDGITIPYAGRLTDEAGQPVADGAYDLTLSLYDAAFGGTLLWSEVQAGVAVGGGSFTAFLGRVTPLPESILADGSCWLEVAVRGPGADAFTPLSPRQALRPALPSTQAGVNAGAPCPHDHWGESWGDSSMGVNFPGPFVALHGHSQTWAGVLGQSTTNIGVLGLSTDATGVHGQSTNNDAGFFDSDSANYLDGDVALGGAVGKLVAHDGGGAELYLSALGDVAVKLDADKNGTHSFQVKNGLDFSVCWIEENGNLTCSGTKSAVVDTRETGWRQVYAVESPEVWHEDLGTASLMDGEVTVLFEPIYARTVNLADDYHVFVTPLSAEPVWLYVTAKTTSGFTVRGVTLDGRPAACALDYRVMAKRLGYEDVRLAPFAPVEVGR
ncbi:MAG: hypothetical protein JW900_14350 [Anaerolineae bacterium]|nr:hypothetical protein [Anaerolineae bacterium]